MTNPYPLPRETREAPVFFGNGGTTYGPFAFKIWDPVDVVAEVDRGTGTYAAEPVTVTKVAGLIFDNFTVTFSPALAPTHRAKVQSRRLHERSTDVTRGGSVSTAGLEGELSRQGTVVQELRRDADDNKGGLGQERAERIAADILERLERITADAAEQAARIAGDLRVTGLIGDHYAKGTINPHNVSSVEAAKLLSFADTVLYLRTAGRALPGDGEGRLYASANSAAEAGQFGFSTNGGTKWWRPLDYRGVTSDGELALRSRKPRKLYSRLYANASSVAPLRYVTLGDSLAGRKFMNLASVLDRKFGGRGGGGTNTAGNAGGYAVSAGSDMFTANVTGVTFTSGDYAYWPTGALQVFAAGGGLDYISGGVSPTFTKVQIFYVKEPGAGTLTLALDGAVVGTADADAPIGLGVLEYSQALAKKTVRVTASGAPVRVLFGHFQNYMTGGIDKYEAFSIGGMRLATGMANANARNIFQQALAHITADFVTFEMDDDFAVGTSDGNAFITLEGILNAAVPYADKVIIGSTPRASNDAGKRISSAFLRSRVAENNASWLFFDSYHIMGSYADQIAIFGSDDGVHPQNSASAFASEQMLAFLGLPISAHGREPLPVSAHYSPSFLGRGTTFSGSVYDLVIDGDSGGYNWFAGVNRSFGVKNQAGTTIWQVSANIAIEKNIAPAAVTFDSSAGTRSTRMQGHGNQTYYELLDTANGSGRLNILAGLMRPGSFTRAQLIAIAANSHPGALAWCSDATGGASLVYAQGTNGPADWRKVDGGTVI